MQLLESNRTTLYRIQECLLELETIELLCVSHATVAVQRPVSDHVHSTNELFNFVTHVTKHPGHWRDITL